jgi:hypothetical protein
MPVLKSQVASATQKKETGGTILIFFFFIGILRGVLSM